MIGTTNIISRKGETEKVNLTLKTDQSSHSVLVGAVITVSYGSYSKDYTWNGTSMVIEVPAYVEYTITFGTVSGYTAPASMTYTAQAGNSRTVNAVYTIAVETVTVKVTGISSGFTVSVVNSATGETIGTQITASKTYSIEEGTKYYVTGSSVSGYVSPSNSATYTAVAGNARSVVMAYVAHSGTLSPSNGVYIQDTDGFFHTESEWDGTYTADCVAVITSNCRFGIALTEAPSEMSIYVSSSGKLENYMTAISDETQAKADYNGVANTANIIKLQPSTDYAAGWCNAFSFPSGKNGFLPSFGQMWAAYSNKTAVNAALTKAGGTAFNSDYYWTSTFWGELSDYRICWMLSWYDGYVSKANLLYINPVRAFCSI